MSHSLTQVATEFFNYITIEKRLSAHTISNYQRDLDKFFGFMHTIKPSSKDSFCDVSIVNEVHVRQCLTTFHRQGLKGKSIQRWLSALRSFFRFAVSKGYCINNPAALVSAPKSSKKLPKTMDVDQTIQLVELKGRQWIDARDRAILELFYSSGLRLSELVNLDISNIDFTGKELTVFGKGSKERILPIGRKAMAQLKDWCKSRNVFSLESNDALFISTKGTRLSARAIQKRVEEAAKKQGIMNHVHPHMLRHSFASHMLESSGDLRIVQEMLGHANLSTTQIYTHLDFQHLAKIHDKAHPRKSMQIEKK